MAIFSNGFETGDLSKFTVINGNITIDNTVSHHGAYSAKANDAAVVAQEARIAFTAIYTTVHARAYYRFDKLGTTLFASHKILTIAGIGGDIAYAQLVKFTVDGFEWQLNGINNGIEEQVNAGVTVIIDPLHWYCVELRAVINATIGEYRLYVEGTEVAKLTGKDTDNFGNPNNVFFEAFTADGPDTLHFDCCVVDTAYIGQELAFDSQNVTLSETDHTSLAVGGCGSRLRSIHRTTFMPVIIQL